MTETYCCFTRTWWRWEYAQDGTVATRRKVAGAGPKSRRGHPHSLSWDEAVAYCRDWNATHMPGPLSRKCEFEVEP